MLKILNFGVALLSFITFLAILVGSIEMVCNPLIYLAVSFYALSAFLREFIK